MPTLFYYPPRQTPDRVRLARGVAVAADLLQVALTPFTVEGAFSPVDDGIDIVAAVVLTALVGWHISFVPSFLVKLLPIADLAPTWTLATVLATAGSKAIESDRPTADLPGLGYAPAAPGRSPAGAILVFAVTFTVGFLVGGDLILPRVWAGAATAGRVAFWSHNWPGAVLGGGLALLFAAVTGRRRRAAA